MYGSQTLGLNEKYWINILASLLLQHSPPMFYTTVLERQWLALTSQDWQGLATLPQGNQEPLVAKTRIEDPQVGLGEARLWNVIFSLQCSDTVGWATGRASGL